MISLNDIWPIMRIFCMLTHLSDSSLHTLTNSDWTENVIHLYLSLSVEKQRQSEF